ncbi:MAG TPA: trehalose-6-phosphate synthase, partial [Polyangiales bacterium]|nr:trehalose-6-phosphate synthase [Polyangiales bacterium]
MRLTFRFTAILIVGLALLTLAAYATLSYVTHDWFESDVATRSELVVRSAGQRLIDNWRHGDLEALSAQLRDFAQGRRILAVAACDARGATLVRSDEYPASLACERVNARLAAERGIADGSDGVPGFSVNVAGMGDVFVTSVPLRDQGALLGTLVFLNDRSFVGKREDAARNLVLAAFAVIALAASAMTVFAARFAWRGLVLELRRMLRGKVPSSPEYQPLLKDLRSLVQRLSNENDSEQRGGRWTPARLKAALGQHLRGERVVVVANREPYIHERGADGQVRVLHPASGLVTALEPVLRACSGVWIAHGGGSADREMADARGRVRVPPGEESYELRRVWLTEAEERGYYYGFANEGLWPLCHLAHTRPTFRAEDFEHYSHVNQKFADAVCDEVESDDPIILVQDYHFALAPKLIRKRLPRAAILTFWHIPWPNAERLGICPYRKELLEGLLGSSIVGFHTQQHCNNFIDSADAFMESRIDREANAIIQGSRRTLVRPYPISIEWPVRWLADAPSIEDCRASVRAELDLPLDHLLGVG